MSVQEAIGDALQGAFEQQAPATFQNVVQAPRPPETDFLTISQMPYVQIMGPTISFDYRPDWHAAHLFIYDIYLLILEWDETATGMARIAAVVDQAKLAIHTKLREVDEAGSQVITNTDIRTIQAPSGTYPLFVVRMRVDITYVGSVEAI